MKVNNKIDERLDPILSASACARLLKDLHGAGGDWSTALSGYNGGFIWQYLKEARRGDRQKGYEHYLSFIEDRINGIRDEIKSSAEVVYSVRRGDTLAGIARKYGVSLDEVLKHNKISDPSKINLGQKIKINNKSENQKNIFWKNISGYSENLNYPAKFYAVLELIQEGIVKEQDAPMKFSLHKIEGGGKHEVRPGEWGLKIARQYGTSLKSLKDANPGINIESLKPNQVLRIPNQASSLSELASAKGLDLQILKFLNPGILNERAPLPVGYSIKV